jgi:class 3 adenylate cyclase
MTRLDSISTPSDVDVLVSFTSLAGSNKRFVLAGEDHKTFNSMYDYFQWGGKFIQSQGGTVIKCMGDAMLVVFPAEAANQAVLTLKEFKTSGDEWLISRKIPCHHLMKLHLGPVVMGAIGVPGQERLDVYGKTVNICAALESGPWVMTPQVFRSLDATSRQQFKKHSLPTTYIRVEDSH